MEKFTTLTGVAAPLDAANVDTDQIIPKQFLLAVDRKGYGVSKLEFNNNGQDVEAKNQVGQAYLGLTHMF